MNTTDTAAVSQPFQAEVSELLHLMVHSVYSETDIFLRELISNASDACDKLRYEAIAKPELIADGEAPKIRIIPNKKGDTLAVADTGIGMDRQELIDNLGTIARSGTKSFLSRLTEAKDGAGLIGQFGVGFYSAFMVAKSVKVYSHSWRKDEPGQLWTSDGAGYAIENRLALSRAIPDIYRKAHVKRVAPFFQAFQAELFEYNRQDDARVCLLTPGPMNETYFEHAYLARYLGLLLIEGEDLVVRDDGTGFDPETRPQPNRGHFGLDGMRERVERLGGKLRIESSPGHGTSVHAEVLLASFDEELA